MGSLVRRWAMQIVCQQPQALWICIIFFVNIVFTDHYPTAKLLAEQMIHKQRGYAPGKFEAPDRRCAIFALSHWTEKPAQQPDCNHFAMEYSEGMFLAIDIRRGRYFAGWIEIASGKRTEPGAESLPDFDGPPMSHINKQGCSNGIQL